MLKLDFKMLTDFFYGEVVNLCLKNSIYYYLMEYGNVSISLLFLRQFSCCLNQRSSRLAEHVNEYCTIDNRLL